MKRIILIRHGKAEDEASGISDFERSLTLKGKLVSQHMARKLSEKEKSLGTILTSPAFRALETALIFASEFGADADKVVMKSEIYYKMSLQNLMSFLSGIDEEEELVTLFGHNPSFTQIANTLSKEGCDMMPKSGVICISFKIMTWSDIGRNNGRIEYFLKPE
jgi:phosphohistidine phosphatase